MDLAGTTVGSYHLVRKLGEGGMGAVYLAEHTLLGRRAALKVLLPAFSSQPEVVNRFFNEARVTTSIADLGIVQVFDFGYHTDGSAFIVMELLDGESVDARIGRLGRLVPADGVRLVRQIATSLAAAHARGVVHRDLKPENLFIVADAAVIGGERTKILDFGIAKLAGEQPGRMKTRTGAVIGTPTYMSPEQCRGLGEIDHRSDVYALGCVLFCMLTGRPPFDGEGLGEIIYAHLAQPAPAPSMMVPGISRELDDLVRRCLAKSPDQRFQSMDELGAALAAVEARPGDGGSGPVAPRTSAPAARRGLIETTLGASSGQPGRPATAAGPVRPAPRILAVGVAVVGLVVAVMVLGRGARGGTRGAPPIAAARSPEPPVDAGVDAGATDATPAPIDAAAPDPIDAGPSSPPARPRARPTPKHHDDTTPPIDRAD